ncbi:MAG TPA: protein kinase [Sandaracinaceae bacterium LLY-WYZ-13_1]|nr:protein kinase [Sandaracinaceae bacterium LLY-WYZ-13_1]
MSPEELESRVEALVEVGRHAEAADLCAAAGEAARAGELYAAVWNWDQAIAITEQNGLLDQAYRHALSAGDRHACGRLADALEEHPEQAVRAAVHAQAKGRTLDAARLREAAGEMEAAAELYERSSEYRDAARCRLALGQSRAAGMLFEKRLKEDPDDAESALSLGRILAQFGRWDHAVRALQKAARDPAHEAAALKLMIASFAAMGMDEAAGSRLDALRGIEPGLPVTVPALLQQLYGHERGLAALVGEGADGERMLAGRYRVIQQLGAGATGKVLLAHDAFHEREVAIKVLHVGGGGAGRDAFVRFAREARVAAGISHPNVVQVHEFNPDGPFLVMEHMAGGTLEDRLVGPDERPRIYPPAQTVLVMKAVLAALEAVHRRGVVHRDLKPANVFFGAGGDIKLGDFGVAHLTDLGATLTGAMMGTLAYMAPEQITGSRRPDAGTDLYALGVILFRCLTGRLPFEGPDFVTQHLEESPPRPGAVAPYLGTAFDALLGALLAKEPRERPSSANEVLEAVRALPWHEVEVPDAGAPATARRSEAPPPSEEEGAERYRVLGPGPGGVTLARDELLQRTVEIVEVDAARAGRLVAFARADGPFLQAVYEVDEGGGRAILEHPSGDPLARLAPDHPRRAEALDQTRRALTRLHAERVFHGAVDARHVLVGPARACLRIALDPSVEDPESDWAGLDAIGGRAAPR